MQSASELESESYAELDEDDKGVEWMLE